jgi:hypothetical protein
VPTWYTYAAMLPGLWLCAIASFWCTAEKLGEARR